MNFYHLAILAVLFAAICFFFNKLRRLTSYTVAHVKKFIRYSPITYMSDDRLTPVSRRRLQMVKKKTLVLDMDETLMTSWVRKSNESINGLPNPLFDYSFYLEAYDVTIYIYKRPYVDFFLDCVARWYDIVVFTAASQAYASPVLDYLDNGRGILKRRFYRHNRVEIHGQRAKLVSVAERDLANVLLLDNCIEECSYNAGNSVCIESYRIGARDEGLIDLLPFLDALRFVYDVRSVLRRNAHFECLTDANNLLK